MTAATRPRNTPARDGTRFGRRVAAGARIQQGTIVALAAGLAAPATTALGLVADGRARSSVDNTGGAAGAVTIEVDKGTFLFASAAGGDLIGDGDIGHLAYLVDDQTVAKTDGGGTRSVAGKIMDVDASGVWVRFD